MAAVTPARSRSGPAAQLEVEQELARLLRRGRLALSAYAARIHPDIDVSGYTLLLAVRDATTGEDGKAVRAADLAGRLGLHKSTLSRGLAQLESLGLVERVADPTDARAREVRVSREGARRLQRVRDERRAKLADVLDRWDEGDLRTLVRLLDRLNTDLE